MELYNKEGEFISYTLIKKRPIVDNKRLFPPYEVKWVDKEDNLYIVDYTDYMKVRRYKVEIEK